MSRKSPLKSLGSVFLCLSLFFHTNLSSMEQYCSWHHNVGQKDFFTHIFIFIFPKSRFVTSFFPPFGNEVPSNNDLPSLIFVQIMTGKLLTSVMSPKALEQFGFCFWNWANCCAICCCGIWGAAMVLERLLLLLFMLLLRPLVEWADLERLEKGEKES